jgi:hypothetical protein
LSPALFARPRLPWRWAPAHARILLFFQTRLDQFCNLLEFGTPFTRLVRPVGCSQAARKLALLFRVLLFSKFLK